jgi:hypothetical protein
MWVENKTFKMAKVACKGCYLLLRCLSAEVTQPPEKIVKTLVQNLFLFVCLSENKKYYVTAYIKVI